jgi:hypothetical protein
VHLLLLLLLVQGWQATAAGSWVAWVVALLAELLAWELLEPTCRGSLAVAAGHVLGCMACWESRGQWGRLAGACDPRGLASVAAGGMQGASGCWARLAS